MLIENTKQVELEDASTEMFKREHIFLQTCHLLPATSDYMGEREVRNMAVQELMSSSLQLILNDGIDEGSGQPIYRTKSFNNVKTTANAEQLYAVSTAMAALQELPLYNVQRRDNSDIFAE